MRKSRRRTYVKKLPYILTLFLYFLNSPLTFAETLTISSQHTFFTKVCENILQSALKHESIDVNYERYPSTRSLKRANEGFVNGELCRIQGVEKKWKNLVMISPPIAAFYGAIFTNKKIKNNIENWKDLKGKKVGIRRGHIYSTIGTAGFNTKNIVKVSTTKQLLGMLELGRIDAAVLIRHNALDIIAKNPEKYQNIKLSNPNIGEFHSYLYLHKSQIDKLEKVAKGIESARNSGSSQMIYNKNISKHNLILQTLLLR